MLDREVTKFTTSPLAVSPHYLLKLQHMNSAFLSQLSQYFITQEKNESVCEISEQYFYKKCSRCPPC